MGLPATIVVPCYNEAHRLAEDQFLELATGAGGPSLLFVDDGSRDHTLARLRALAARCPERIRVHHLPQNAGKAEAVRQGLLAALEGPSDVLGYLDADLATPVGEARRLLDVMQATRADVVLAARVALLGRDIRRSAVRHYLGRVFATAASVVLGLAVYDTQCGAKLIRRSPALVHALREPFLSRWVFDVELLGRLLAGGDDVPPVPVEAVREEPLLVWHDVPGSKLTPRDMATAAADLLRIAVRRHAAARRRAAAASRRVPETVGARATEVRD
jgi:glycosyltransferase involved in cell wall biosynthesis